MKRFILAGLSLFILTAAVIPTSHASASGLETDTCHVGGHCTGSGGAAGR